MSGRRNNRHIRERHKKTIRSILFVLATIVLLAGLFVVYKINRQKLQDRAEYIASLQQEEQTAVFVVKETEPVAEEAETDAQPETEKGAETGKQAEKKQTEENVTEKKDASEAGTKEAESEMTKSNPAASEEAESEMTKSNPAASEETESEGSEPQESESAGSDVKEPDKSVSILLVNGARIEGTASYWKLVLNKDGFKNIDTATLAASASSVDTTTIYSDRLPLQNIFEDYFPNAKIVMGDIPYAYEKNGSSQNGEEYQYIILIGRDNPKRNS